MLDYAAVADARIGDGRELVTGPAEEPVTLSEAKIHLRVDGTAEDTLITGLIISARVTVENETNRALITQTWRYYLDRFPCGAIRLPFGRLQSVASVKSTATDGTVRTLATSSYYADTKKLFGLVVLNDGYQWPADNLQPTSAVEVQFACGWTNAAALPGPLKSAILIQVGHLYENREAVVLGNTAAVASAELARGVSHLIAPYKLFTF